MDRKDIDFKVKTLDAITHTDQDGVDFWYARDIMPELNYTEWRNFSKVIEKARVACKNSGQKVESHFLDTTRDVQLGSGAIRSIEDVKLTRYACYLVAQNGDPKKEEVALLQSYFAVQTRTAEILERRMSEISRLAGRKSLAVEEKRLSKLSYERGVDDRGFAYIRSQGDRALFGRTTRDMKARLGVPAGRPLADRLHPINVTAKQLATQMTNWIIEENDLHGAGQIAGEHVSNNASVRNSLLSRGIVPEELPAAEDIEKVERRAKQDEKRIEGSGFKETADGDPV